MTTYKVDIEKLYQNEYWTNVWYVTADNSLSAAADVAGDIVTAEASFHADVVTFTKYRVSTILPGDFSYQTIILNTPGTRNSTGMDFLPLFNVARVDLTDEGFKRPERKYYRCPLAESDQTGGNLTTGILTLINTALGNVMTAWPGRIVGPNAETIISVQTYPKVGMRQLRRGSRRRSTPVIP